MKKTCIYNEIAVILQPNNHQYEETIDHPNNHGHRNRLYRTASPVKAGLEPDGRKARIRESRFG